MRGSVLLTVVVCLVAPSAVGGEEGAAPAAAIFLGDPPQELCPLTPPPEFRFPDPPLPDGLPQVSAEELVLTVRVSRESIEDGVSPQGLRLIRLRPAGSTSTFDLLPISVEGDPQDRELWHVRTGEPLAAGVYDLALERSGLAAGLSKTDHVLYFLGCTFVVDDASDQPGELQE